MTRERKLNGFILQYLLNAKKANKIINMISTTVITAITMFPVVSSFPSPELGGSGAFAK